jgi:hypothetical protein
MGNSLLAIEPPKIRSLKMRFVISSLEFWRVRYSSNRNGLATFCASRLKLPWTVRRRRYSFHVVDAGPVAGDYLNVGVEEGVGNWLEFGFTRSNHTTLHQNQRPASRNGNTTRSPQLKPYRSARYSGEYSTPRKSWRRT